MASRAIPFAAPAANPAYILSTMDRYQIEALIEAAIAWVDDLDGDPDLEDDDPAGDGLDERGEVEDWRPDGVVLPMPVYGVDQTRGPINEREASRAWHEAQRY